MESLVFADTHGNFHLAAEVIMQAGRVDKIFHLGDEVNDAIMLEHLFHRSVEKVAGNCDAPGKFLREICLDIGSTRIFLTHGDNYNVKAGLSQLHNRALSTNAQIVLYGHTHLASIDEIDGILYINPGSLHKGSAAKSYVRLSIKNSGPSAVIVPVRDIGSP